jgi:transcription-repair coupling factor (superfamily II helicase)
MSSTVDSTSILHSALQRVFASKEHKYLVSEIKRGARVVSVSSLVAGSARALALAALQRDTGKLFAVVTESNQDLEPWERDLRFWYSAVSGKENCDNEVLILPASEGDPYAGSSPHAETLEKRALILWRLTRHPLDFLLITARAMALKTVAPLEIARAGALLQRDEECSPQDLVEKFIASGYVREDPVGAVGEFSMRGGILDVWSPGHEAPVRIEFFGDTIDSIREFDSETQLSTEQLASTEIAPMRELAVSSRDFRHWAAAARERWNEERYARALRDRTAFADEGEAFAGWEWLMPLVRERKATVFDYFKDAVLVIDEPSGIETFLGEAYQTLADRYAETDSADDIALAPHELYLTSEELRSKIDERQRLELRTLGRAAAEIDQGLALDAERPRIQLGRTRSTRYPMFLFPIVDHATEVEWKAQSVMRYHGRLSDLAASVVRARENGTITLFVMPSLGVAERVTDILADYEIDARLSLNHEHAESAESAETIVTVGRLSAGFEMPALGLLIHVEGDLFDEAGNQVLARSGVGPEGRRQKAEGKKRRSKTAAFLSDFRDLKPQDYVVHIDHGIARFGGLQTLDLGPRTGEFMLLYFADDAKL